jgi:uncharacterized protein (UPF0297 family)
MNLSGEARAARRRIEFFFGRPIAFHRCFVKLTGSVHAALMLSQALYWLNPERQGQGRGKDEGWFWKTREQWEAELGLSRWEQETARKQLRLTKFWKEKDKRLEHRIYFSVDFVELEKALEAAANPLTTEGTGLLPEGGIPTSGDGGIPSAAEGGIPTSGRAESHPSSEVENPPSRARRDLPRKEHRLLQRLPETSTSSELAAGLHNLMPNTAWDDDAMRVLWSECTNREPDCTVTAVLQQIADKLRMKGWNRIQNPVGFLLASVPPAVQSASNGAKLRAQARAARERASAEREAELRLECERDLSAWKMAEQAFEALPEDRKQNLVDEARRRLLHKNPQYRDRVHLPGWDQCLRSRAIRSLLARTESAP